MLDEEIQNDINRCSRCALCVQNCPIYNIKKDENNTSRGLICKLIGYKKGYLSEKEIKKDFKICLNCSKCKLNCPSKINTSLIFAHKNAQFSPSKISQRLLLALKLLPIKILYIFNFFKKNNKSNLKSNIVYFKGCVAKAQHKKTFLDDIFSQESFICCGLPYLTSGDLKNYNKAKKTNTKIIKDAKTVVFDCATCKNAVAQYDTLNEDDKKKLVFFLDLLNKNYKLKNNSKYKNKTITFHKPCHLDKDDFEKIENFLSKIKDLNYKKLENPESCCGFGGSYFIFHPIISTKIALKKAQTIKNSNADLILTTCPSCTIGLRYNQLISLNCKKTLELRDFIQEELELID